MKTIRSLFAQTFTAISSGDGAIGNLIECHMGCLINSSKKADLGFWELKSKNIASNSKITLGSVGMKGSLDYLINNCEDKMNNTILVWYSKVDNTATVQYIDICYGFNKNLYRSNIGKLIKVESRSNGEKSLRIAKGYFGSMYDKVTRVYPPKN